MNSIAHHPVHYHTWKDLGGPIGLLLNGAFCSFVIVAALGMVIFASLILLADNVASPVLALTSKIPFRPWAVDESQSRPL